MLICADREEATKEGDLQLNDEDDDEEDEDGIEEWDGEEEVAETADDAKDVKDESAAYLDFLTEEVRLSEEPQRGFRLIG